MVVITTLNIIVRRAPFHAPILGSAEISTFLGAMLISLALPLNQLRKGNIAVEMLSSSLPPLVRLVLEKIVLLISGVTCVAIGWQLFEHGFVLAERGEVSMTLAVPFYPLIYVSGLCFEMLAFVLFVQAAAGSDRTDT